MTRRILLHASQKYYVEVGKHLQRRGIEPVAVYVTDHSGLPEAFRAAFPRALQLPAFPLLGAQLPPEAAGIPLHPARTEDIEALAPWEGATLQMMDRRNFDALALHDMRQLYLRYLGMWRSLLDHLRPDAVHLHLTPHQGHDFVLYNLCQRLGIPTLIVEGTYIAERLYVRPRLESYPSPTADEVGLELARHEGRPPPFQVARQHTIARKLVDPNDIDKNLSLRRQLKGLLHPGAWLGGLRPVRDNVFGLTQRRPPELLYRYYDAAGRRGVRETYRFYRQVAREVPTQVPFVFFPLHYQPEKTTLPDGLRFVDQLHLAEAIADALPTGWKLYVKEHARQFNLSHGLRGTNWTKGRSMDFYRRLAALKNVELVSLDQSTATLTETCQAVATITGTTAWEGLQVGRPAVVFGSAWYSSCPGVVKVDDTAAISAALDSIAQRRVTVEVPRVLAWAHVMVQHHTFRGVHWDPLLEQTGMSLDEHGRSCAEALEQALDAATDRRTETAR